MPHISFSREDFETFRATDRPGPIHMLNLVKLREMADYDDYDGGTQVTGAKAYATYGRLTAQILQQVGGRLIWRGAMEQMLIGPADVVWDLCFIVEYPEAAAFLNMLKHPEYQAAVPHRQAAVQDSRLIRMAPLTLGDAFGGSG